MTGARIGYVLKMFPRFSETFVVNEILAHEAAGEELEIFSLRYPADGRFHGALADVRAPVTYLADQPHRASTLWSALGAASDELPLLWTHMDELVRVPAADALAAVQLAGLVRRRGLERLHAHFGSVATTVTRLAGAIADVPYSFTAHAKDIFHASVDPEDLRRKLADAAAVVTVSDYNLAYLRDRYSTAAARVRRVYNGLDLSRFPFEAPTHRPPRIVAVGRLVEKKGFDDLISACALLARRGTDFSCDLVGEGALRASLQARVDELGISDRVRLIGPRPQEEVRQLVQAASALAAPCVVGSDGNRDGLPTVILEAMALGTPCVSTDVTGIPEILRDADTGLAVPQHAPAALADALERLLTTPALRVRLATGARAMIERDFEIGAQARLVRAHAFSAPPARAAEALHTARSGAA